MPTVSSDFNRTVAGLNLDAERSGIFTPGVRTFDFSDAGLNRFNQCLARVAPGTPSLDATRIGGAARRLARAEGAEGQARFIQARMRRVGEMRALLHDKAWRCDEVLHQRMTDLVAYLDGGHRLFPDYVPVVGALDAALLVDQAMEGLRAELDQYADFCRYRQGGAARHGEEGFKVR